MRQYFTWTYKFDFLRKLKKYNITEMNGLKGRTHEKHSNSEIAESLTKNISDSLKTRDEPWKPLSFLMKKTPKGQIL